MNKIETVFVLALLLFASVLNAQKLRHIKSDKYEGVIFLQFPQNTMEYVPREGLKNLFVPTDHEIDLAETKIENTIKRLVSDYQKNDPDIKIECDIPKDLVKYKRHYYGYLSKKEKIISILLFNDSSIERWDKRQVIAEDGGCSFIYLKYSITNDKIFNFYMKY
ncbi:MAG: hypothetical protein HXX14_09175 [Bacteroidetes bacterium]|nr:hypothetical protein [Bacteroidota bacterium]